MQCRIGILDFRCVFGVGHSKRYSTVTCALSHIPVIQLESLIIELIFVIITFDSDEK